MDSPSPAPEGVCEPIRARQSAEGFEQARDGVVLSVFKLRGLTRYGWRKQQGQPANQKRAALVP